MLRIPRRFTRRPAASIGVALLTFSLSAAATHAAPTLGFREDFPGTTIDAWFGNGVVNPGTDGVFGAGDGFLVIATPEAAQLAARSTGTEYAGNWTTAGITQVRVWLNEINADDALEIHFGIGDQGNFWQYNPGFAPPLHQWGEFVVDLTSAANFTRILTTTPGGTFAQALAGADRILFRHDLAPYTMGPDFAAGDFGVDHILLTNGIVGVEPLPARIGHAMELAAPYPNPARGPVSFSIESFEAGAVSVSIVDIMGRSIRQASLSDLGPGARLWIWDGRDAAGREAPAGVYRVRAMGRSGGTSRTFVRTR